MQVRTKLFIFGVIILGIISLIGIGIFNKVKYKNRVKEDILNLNPIQYLSIDGSLKQIGSTGNFKIIFFFNSECGHCESEAQSVFSNVSSFMNSEIYFFSVEEISVIKRFVNQFNLSMSTGIEIGQVDMNVIHNAGVNTYPICFIYSPKGILLKKYVGEVKIEAIVLHLQ